MGLWLLYVSQEDRRPRSRGFKELQWVHFVGETSETEVVEFVEFYVTSPSALINSPALGDWLPVWRLSPGILCMSLMRGILCEGRGESGEHF